VARGITDKAEGDLHWRRASLRPTALRSNLRHRLGGRWHETLELAWRMQTSPRSCAALQLTAHRHMFAIDAFVLELAIP
jgi:hypothetical protein